MTIPMPEPFAGLQYNSGWDSWEQVVPFAVGQPGVVSVFTQEQMEAYAAAKVREAQRWHPIETAPKDGTAILIGNERGAWIAKYEPVYPSGYRPANPWFSLMLNHNHIRKGKPFGPTHWMPLPAPPLPGPVEP